MSAIVEACDLAAKVLKKPKLCKCGLAELDKEVRINNTVASTASSTSSCPVTDSKVTVEIASLPDSKVNVEIANLPDSKVKVEKASLLEMIECIPDWEAVAFLDEEIKFFMCLSLSGVVEACDLACMVLKKSNLCNSGLAELNKEVRINTVDSTTASSSSCLLPPVSKVKVEKANLPVNL
ncbi:hypothetical protein LWI29_025382 [Acer saccharum]|uniref:Uncharacterized protein n=1 Tax=Acer saccharum TaxID=4024 RepID=A0AA39T2V6_ACESA|nr:hypothetical protein LWI29_025382 [Acer saccharum]